MTCFLAIVLAAGAATSTAAPVPTPVPGAPTPTAAPSSSPPAVFPPVPVVGPAFSTTQTNLPSGDIAGVDGPFVGISLQSAVAMALARNPDLAVSQSNRRIAASQIVAANGAYDVRFLLQPSVAYAKTPSISAFQAGPGGTPIETFSAGAGAGFQVATRGGGVVDLRTSATHVNNNATVNSYDPYYQTAIALSFAQPLGRGARFDATREQIELARINANISDDDALQSASTTLDSVLVAYYNLVAGWKNVAIAEDALRNAQRQSASNARLVRRGAAAPVDVIESDTQVNEFQNNVYSAIANVASLQNSLKTLMLGDPADPAWSANLVPTTPVSVIVAEPSVGDLVATALRNRPEIAQLRDAMRSQDVSVAYANEQRKPQIDLSASIAENGFAGRATDPNANPIAAVIGSEVGAINALIARANATAPPGTAPLPPLAGGFGGPLYPGSIGGLGESYKSALQGKYPQYSLGATIAFPLRNQTAEATYRGAVERRAGLVDQEVSLVQRIEAEARNAIQGYRSARSRLIAATAARIAAERVLASTERRFASGRSTTFLVLQRQVTVFNERSTELQAQSDVQKALVEIDRVSGDLLAKNGVDVTTLGTTPRGKVPALVP